MKMLAAVLFATALPAEVITVTSSGGTYSPVSVSNVIAALNAARCGDEVQMEAGTPVRTGFDVVRIADSGSTATVTFATDHFLTTPGVIWIAGVTGAGTGLNKAWNIADVPTAQTVTINTGSGVPDGEYGNPGITAHHRVIVVPYDASKKVCAPGNEIVVTTTKKDWLPDADMRITPSYKPLLARLVLKGHNASNPLLTLQDSIVGMKFVGLSFEKEGVNPTNTWILIRLAHSDTGITPASLLDNITFDRNLIQNDFAPGSSWQVTVKGQAIKVVNLVNNFLDNHMSLPSDGESYFWQCATCLGPFVIRNNYMGNAMSIGALWGGTATHYTTGNPAPDQILYEHNYNYISPKRYPQSPNYVGNAYASLVKNCAELKVGTNATFRWNGCENVWAGGGSQWYGYTITIRNNNDAGVGVCSLDAAKTTLTCPGNNATLKEGQAIGVDKGSGNVFTRYQWRKITAADNATKRYQVNGPFDEITNSSNLAWAYVLTPWNKIDNVLIYGNYFRNVATPVLVMGRDGRYAAATESYAKNVTFTNNLMVYDSPLMTFLPSVTEYLEQHMGRAVNGGGGLTFRNNTAHFKPTFTHRQYPATFNLDPQHNSYGPIEGFVFENNLDTAFNGVGSGDGYINTQAAKGLTTGISYRNNLSGTYQPFYQPCPPGNCAGNVFSNYSDAFVDESANDYRVSTASPYSKAGVNGESLGADMEEVAVIRDLRVEAMPKALLFFWTVPAYMSQMGCSLEVSPDSNLTTDLGPYAVVNALRPDYFIRADSDRANKRATIGDEGRTRRFQVGDDAVEVDDNGVERDLGLAPGTTYCYRLMCGGATERGSVKTAPPPASSVNEEAEVRISIKAKPAKGTRIRPRYGPNVKSLIQGAAVACASGCTVLIPARPGRQLVYYLDELDEEGREVVREKRPMVIPVT